MDIYCAHCGEPSDVYHVYHDMEPEYKEMFLAGNGCDCCLGKPERKVENTRTLAMSACFELMGDDLDGAASMMDDFEFLGMLD